MDLKSGYPFWAVKNGLMTTFDTLQQNIDTELVIIGGGITGALLADHFNTQGYAVTVIDRREIGWGSSAASTALLQYEIDTHMVDLAKQYGEQNAYLAYQACADAILQLKKIVSNFADVDFAMQQSLYYASNDKDAKNMRDEFALRRKYGFAANWLEPAALKAQFGIDAPGAILTELAARIDPYKTAHKLLRRVRSNGGQVFERSAVSSLQATESGVSMLSGSGHRIEAKHVIIASGYESQNFIKQSVAKNHSSYAFISDPLSPAALGKLTDTMVWESARPYIYMRTTGDGRLLVGGEDDPIDIPAKRDAKVQKKATTLADKVHALFPQLEFEQGFAWGGTFAETDDGLPFFGPHEELGSRVHFAMAYGGNGISYSVIGCELLQAWIEQKEHPLKSLFSFSRLSE